MTTLSRSFVANRGEQRVDELLPTVRFVVVRVQLLHLIDREDNRFVSFGIGGLGDGRFELVEAASTGWKIATDHCSLPTRAPRRRAGMTPARTSELLPLAEAPTMATKRRSAEPIEDDIDLLVAAVEAVGVVFAVREQPHVGAVARVELAVPEHIAARHSMRKALELAQSRGARRKDSYVVRPGVERGRSRGSSWARRDRRVGRPRRWPGPTSCRPRAELPRPPRARSAVRGPASLTSDRSSERRVGCQSHTRDSGRQLRGRPRPSRRPTSGSRDPRVARPSTAACGTGLRSGSRWRRLPADAAVRSTARGQRRENATVVGSAIDETVAVKAPPVRSQPTPRSEQPRLRQTDRRPTSTLPL